MKKRTVLAVGAHADDIEFSCTGTLLKLEKKGYDVYYVILTNGENGFKAGQKPKTERIKIRKKEQINAAYLLGAKKVYFLNYRDGFLEYTDNLRKQLAMIIKEVKPEIIFSFDPGNHSFERINLHHRDHRITGLAVYDAVFAAKNRYMYPGEPHKVDYLYLFGSDKPNYFENITSLIKQKIDILKCHKSQFDDFKKTEDWIRNYISKFTDKYKYSEAFRVVKIEQIFK